MNLFEKVINFSLNRNFNLDDLLFLVNKNKNYSEIISFHTMLINKNIEIIKSEYNKNNSILMNKQSFKEIKNDIILKKQSNKIYFLSNQNTETYVFGDLHGDFISLFTYVKKTDLINKIKKGKDVQLIFLGDYVDRGKEAFKVLEFIMILKILFPQNIFMLRGNHDGGTLINENEYKLCVGRNKGLTDADYFVANMFNTLTEKKLPKEFLATYLYFFDTLCTLAVIFSKEQVFLCTHGGIPRPINDNFSHLKSINALTDEKFKDHLEKTTTYNMLWSDPAESTDMVRNTGRFYFYKNNFDAFTSQFGIDKIIRAHQAFENGYKYFFDKKLISIFSSGINKNGNIQTAYKDIFPCLLNIKCEYFNIIR